MLSFVVVKILEQNSLHKTVVLWCVCVCVYFLLQVGVRGLCAFLLLSLAPLLGVLQHYRIIESLSPFYLHLRLTDRRSACMRQGLNGQGSKVTCDNPETLEGPNTELISQANL